MSTVSFFKDAAQLVSQGLQAIPLINPAVSLDATNKIVYCRTESSDGKDHVVSIISGGGSGHEPGFAGYVGRGLLTASVAGTVFASPSSEQIRRALLGCVPREKGVLVVTMNYTGDVLNFGMAVEKARAHGVATELLVVADDVAVGRTKGGKVGRRGIAGTVLVVKILGALAQRGGTLQELKELGESLTRNLVSVGSSLLRVTIPGRDPPAESEQVLRGQVELGMGIHNETGTCQMTACLEEVVEAMLKLMLDPTDSDRHFVDITSSDQVVLLINNLGGLSTLEMSAITHEVCVQAENRHGVIPVRVLCGPFLTSLNAPGWSATFLKINDSHVGSANFILDLLDEPAQAPAWPSSVNHRIAQPQHNHERAMTDPQQQKQVQPTNLTFDPAQAAAVLSHGLERVVTAEPRITRLDSIVGDGDCGIGFRRGCEAILQLFSQVSKLSTNPITFLNDIGNVIETTMDGTSGAIIAIFVAALSAALRTISDESDPDTVVSVELWARALQMAIQSLGRYTPAGLGDRTMLDSLIPFVDTLQATGSIVQAAEVAERCAEETKNLEPRLGRTTYIGSKERWLGTIPDPGAVGLAVLFAGMAEWFTSNGV